MQSPITSQVVLFAAAYAKHEGFRAARLPNSFCCSVAHGTNGRPTKDAIIAIATLNPSANSKQLDEMRKAAGQLRRANCDGDAIPAVKPHPKDTSTNARQIYERHRHHHQRLRRGRHQ